MAVTIEPGANRVGQIMQATRQAIRRRPCCPENGPSASSKCDSCHTFSALCKNWQAGVTRAVCPSVKESDALRRCKVFALALAQIRLFRITQLRGDPIDFILGTRATEERAVDDVRKQIDATLAELRQEADELRVKVHLAKLEAKDEWRDLEAKLAKLEAKGNELAGVSADAATEIAAAARLLGDEIRNGFKKIAEHL